MNSVSFNCVPNESTRLNGMLNTGFNKLSGQHWAASRVETLGRCFFAALGSLGNVLGYTFYALGNVCVLNFASARNNCWNALASCVGVPLLVVVAVAGIVSPKWTYQTILGAKHPTAVEIAQARYDEADRKEKTLASKLQEFQEQLQEVQEQSKEAQAQLEEAKSQLGKAKNEADVKKAEGEVGRVPNTENVENSDSASSSEDSSGCGS